MEAKKAMKELADAKRGSWAVSAAVLAAVVMTVLIVSGRKVGAPVVWVQTAAASFRQGSNDLSILHPRTAHHDRLYGGLLVDGFDMESCHSRYQSAMYRRNPGRRPSPYLISKLRRHEALQRRCGPGTAAYSTALAQLKSGKSVASPECDYILSISYQGIGNRILATTSAFLYAVLTDRVLLIDPSNEMDELFCEPFPNTTWLLPPGFPLTDYANFSVDTAESYGNMVKNKVISRSDVVGVADDDDILTAAAQLPAFAYVHLNHDATIEDNSFFCGDNQRLLRRIQWLVMRTDNYMVPGLFVVPAFQEELDAMFPERDAVFHHLSRYLFHPNNDVWGLVTRYYDTYLAAPRQRIGIQVRVFGGQPDSPELLEQITTCTQKEGLLPELLPAAAGEPILPASRARSKAVLVTSLRSWYYERMKSMYWEHATATGEVVSLHQPSHEEFQQSGARSHEHKAWAEIYLLSLTDVLVTSGRSTFGYVAQGLAGVRPWVLYKATNSSAVPDPPCGRDVSMEPCFHKPPDHDCRLKQWADPFKDVPYIQHCNDAIWGVKLVGRNT